MQEELSVLRPMEIGDIFDEAFTLYKKNFVTFFGIAAIVYIPFEILSYMLILSSAQPVQGQVDPTILLVALGGVLILMLSLNFTNAALTKAISDSHTGEQTSIGSAYGNILVRAFPLIITLLLVGLLVSIGYMLLIIPGILLTFMAVFVSQVFVVEDRRYFDAFSRSRELAKENWMRIFIIAIIGAVINGVVGFGSEWLGGMLSNSPVILGVITGLANSFVLPIVSAAYVLLYFDIRVRKEGFDLELLAREMQTPGYSRSQQM